jgi:tetratricopeptide (TPR) repeat protein
MVPLLLALLCAANGGTPADRAKALTGLANEDFEHGRYPQAAQEYQEADRLIPKATLLLKIAKSYEKAGDLAKATDAYRDYLRRSPFASNRAAIKRTIARLTKQMKQGQDSLALVPLSGAQNPVALVPLTGAQNPVALVPLSEPQSPVALVPLTPAAPPAPQEVTAYPPTPPLPSVEATAAEPPHKSLTPILMTTGGAVAVALAAVTAYWGGWGLDALSTSQTNQNRAAPTYKGVYDNEIGEYKLQAGAWLTVSAVLAASGIYMLVVGPSWGAASESSAVSVAPMPGGGGVTWSGTFR